MADNIFKISTDWAEYLLGAAEGALNKITEVASGAFTALKTGSYNLIDSVSNGALSGRSESQNDNLAATNETAANTPSGEEKTGKITALNIDKNSNLYQSVSGIVESLRSGELPWLANMENVDKSTAANLVPQPAVAIGNDLLKKSEQNSVA